MVRCCGDRKAVVNNQTGERGERGCDKDICRSGRAENGAGEGWRNVFGDVRRLCFGMRYRTPSWVVGAQRQFWSRMSGTGPAGGLSGERPSD